VRNDDHLPPLDDCQRLEACAVHFVQVSWPLGRAPITPGTWSIDKTAKTLEDLCPSALDLAADSMKQWTVTRFPRLDGKPTERCEPDAPRLGPALRQACAGQWDQPR
jgi:hypothetical protein